MQNEHILKTTKSYCTGKSTLLAQSFADDDCYVIDLLNPEQEEQHA